MREIAFAVLCVLGWAGFLVFSLLRVFGVIEVSGDVAIVVLLAIIPLSIAMPWAVEATQRLSISAVALVALAVILAPMSLLDMGERVRDRTEHLP